MTQYVLVVVGGTMLGGSIVRLFLDPRFKHVFFGVLGFWLMFAGVFA